MSKISKLLVMLLALVMVVSLIAGCKPTSQPSLQNPNNSQGSNNNPTGGNNSGNNNATEPTGSDEFTGANMIKNDMFPLEEPITFKMAVRGEKDYQAMMEKCEWYKYLCEQTNVFIEVVVLGSDAVGKLNTLVATGSAPDVVLGPITLGSTQIIDLAENGLLLELDDYATDPEIMPNYQRLLKAVPQALNKMRAPDGNIWSLAIITGTPGTVWESPLTCNIDWLKQVPGYESGEKFPETVEEFTEVLRYYKSHDMNGNGDPDDEIPFLMVSSSTSPADTQGTLQGLMQLWGIGTKDSNNDYYVHISDDDEVTLAPTTENYRDCLEWVSLWYEEDLLWENFFSSVTNPDFTAVSGNDTALWGFFNGSNWYNNGPLKENTAPPWGDSQTLVVPFDTGYDPHLFLNPGLYGNLNAFTVFNTCEEPEILLAWYDQFMSLEGTLCTYYGIPNEWELYDDAEQYRAYYEANPSWYIDEDGMPHFASVEQEDYVSLYDYDTELEDKRLADHPYWAGVFNLNAVFQGVTPNEYAIGAYPNDPYSEAIVLGKWIDEHPDYFDWNVWLRPYTTAEEAEALTEYWPQVQRVILLWEVDFIKGDKSLETDWEEYQQELVDAGIEYMIEALQSAWDRVKD
ncbi:MAG: extracellular solute-binding protein [Oscillospiraceae bacterium]|nr:extracellular solute-binding protein [Oscillospiraceae bacterium]